MTRRAITGALLFDGSEAPPASGGTVVWEDGRIVSVGPDGALDLEGAEVIEAGGDALLPGLIDGHVHLSFDGTLHGVDTVATEPMETVRERAFRGARILLGAGITTARDQGSRHGVAIEVAAAQRAGEITGSRILASGRGITPTGGHGWMIGVEADGPDAVRRAVAAEIERGADVIKLFPTGGVLGTGAHGFDLVMSAEEVGAAVAEAHAHGRLVGAHVHGVPGIEMALDAGVDTIEHATGITDEQARRVVDQGVALVPTLTAMDVLVSSDVDLGAELQARVDEVLAVAASGIARAIAAGAVVLAGTDAGTPLNPPGRLAAEMEILSGLGLGALGAIAAATSRAAEVFRLEGLGVVAPGAIADLILVPGDPSADLGVLARPRLVIQAGEVIAG